jgi:hypothetical protein
MRVPVRVWIAVTLAVLVRPSLWWPALRQSARLAPRRWWRRPPFLPIPDRGVVAFRLATAYGTSGRVSASDVVRYLRWAATRR